MLPSPGTLAGRGGRPVARDCGVRVRGAGGELLELVTVAAEGDDATLELVPAAVDDEPAHPPRRRVG